MPQFNDLDILKIVFRKKKIRPKDITKHICEIEKQNRNLDIDIDHFNCIKTNVSRKLDRMVDDGFLLREYETAKKVWYKPSKKTRSEIFRLTQKLSKHYDFGSFGFSVYEGKLTFFFEPQDPEVVSKTIDLYKNDREELIQLTKLIMATLRFTIRDLVLSNTEKTLVSATFFEPKEQVFFTGKLSKETSKLMKKVVDQDILRNYTQILSEGMSPLNNFWNLFGDGKTSIEVPSGKLFEYDKTKQKVTEVDPKKRKIAILKKQGVFSTGKRV